MEVDKFLLAFCIIILYVILLFFLKKIEWGKKQISNNCNNCCPDCKAPLNRVQRQRIDHVIHDITFRIFDCRRYFCSNCGWEGLRWED